MDMGSKIAAIIYGALIMYMLIRFIRSNPESISLTNINKSMYAMGLLALILIGFIGIVVMLLRRA